MEGHGTALAEKLSSGPPDPTVKVERRSERVHSHCHRRIHWTPAQILEASSAYSALFLPLPVLILVTLSIIG